jgi:hypothetical protein
MSLTVAITVSVGSVNRMEAVATLWVNIAKSETPSSLNSARDDGKWKPLAYGRRGGCHRKRAIFRTD